MKSKKDLFYFFIGWLIVVALTAYIITLFYSPGNFELVSFENAVATLKWHGVNGTRLRLAEIAVQNVGSLGTLRWYEYGLGYQTVNDGDVLTFSMAGGRVQVKIYYYNRLVTIRQDGGFSEEFVFYPLK